MEKSTVIEQTLSDAANPVEKLEVTNSNPTITSDSIKKSLEEKALNNTNIEDVKKQVSDVEVFGNGDLFQLIAKASSKEQGWMKSTKAMAIPGVGCVVQVTTQQRNPSGAYVIAEALTFVPNVSIHTDGNGDKYLG